MPDQEQTLRAQFDLLHSGQESVQALTLLDIGDETTEVISASGTSAPIRLTLAIGAQKTAREFLSHTPPSAADMERAIMDVEDQVARASACLPPDSTLFAISAPLREIALLAGAPDQNPTQLSRAALEQTFEQLAQASMGAPARRDLPNTPEFAARLLILREWMHHLRFASITLLS